MRNISAASLAKLAQRTGTEPMILLSVSWIDGYPPVLYAEKSLPDLNIEGRIITTGQIDDILNVSQNGTSQSFSVTLDDSDGVLKQYFDNIDFHRRPVAVYQWFTGLPLSDTFLLFYGLISSPIIWKEYERILSFTVLSKTEGLEVGFSPEEGSFSYVPMNIVGKMWPLPFGTVGKSPTICIDTIPNNNSSQQKGTTAASVTKDPTGIEDPTLELQITRMTNEAALAGDLAKAYFEAYLFASNSARLHGEIGEFDFVNQGQGTFSQLAQQYQQAGNNMLATQTNLRNKAEALQKKLNLQKSFKKKQIRITNGEKYPQGQKLSLTINGAVHTGYFTGETFNVTDAQHPNASLYTNFQLPSATIDQPALTQPVLNRDTFFWADASTQVGTPFNINENPNTHYPIRYIVSGGIEVAVLAVYAYRTVNNLRTIYPVPGNLFVQYNTLFGVLPVTLIQLPNALSSLTDDKGNTQGWEDELYVTCISSVGPNTIDEMIWIIENFTDMTYDSVSFNHVRELLIAYPSNFTLTKQVDAVKLLQDMAYQARCLLFTKNNIFYIIYLGNEPTPVDTITEADIIHQSLEIQTTETEDLATRYIAKWRPDYLPGDEYSIIYRFNLNQYQLITKTVDYFIYNIQYLVALSATYWLIKESNIFKKVVFKTPIHKLNLETMDYITLNFSNNFATKGPIVGRIESAIFDSNDYTITFTVWIPVLLGSNTKFPFVYPNDLSVTAVWPTPEDVSSGKAQTSDVTLPTDQNLPQSIKNPMSGDPGDVPPIQTPGLVPNTWGAGIPNFNNPALNPTINTAVNSSTIQQTGRPTNVDNYQYDNSRIVKQNIAPVLGVIPAQILSIDPNDDGTTTYTCNLYYQGRDNPPAQQSQIQRLNPSLSLAPLQINTYVWVVRYVWVDNNATPPTTNFQMFIIETSGQGAIIGRVETKNGDGTYVCTAFNNGINDSSSTTTLNSVTQMQIDSTDTIPQGTMTFIFPSAGKGSGSGNQLYYMQVPVWLSSSGSGSGS